MHVYDITKLEPSPVATIFYFWPFGSKRGGSILLIDVWLNALPPVVMMLLGSMHAT